MKKTIILSALFLGIIFFGCSSNQTEQTPPLDSLTLQLENAINTIDSSISVIDTTIVQ
jgi:hypothetical protein